MSLRFLDLVKCINSFLTWSNCRPLCVSHAWVSSNAMVLMLVVVLRSGPDVRMALSSTYSVIGESMIFLSFMRGLSSADSAMRLFVLVCTSSIIGDVKYAARIGKAHDPCGMPVSIVQNSSLLPLRHIDALQSCRNECTHLAIGRGICSVRMVLRRCE